MSDSHPKNVDAVFQDGAFHLLDGNSVHLPDGTRVKITVESADRKKPSDVLALAANVYRGLSDNDIAEIEAVTLDRSQFFSN